MIGVEDAVFRREVIHRVGDRSTNGRIVYIYYMQMFFWHFLLVHATFWVDEHIQEKCQHDESF